MILAKQMMNLKLAPPCELMKKWEVVIQDEDVWKRITAKHYWALQPTGWNGH
jgi:hypothetical protein